MRKKRATTTSNASRLARRRKDYAVNRDRYNERARKRRAANPQKYRDYEKERSRRRRAEQREALRKYQREYMRKRRAANPEKDREYQRARYHADPERFRNYSLKSRQKNRDRYNALARKRRAANPEKFREYERQWSRKRRARNRQLLERAAKLLEGRPRKDDGAKIARLKAQNMEWREIKVVMDRDTGEHRAVSAYKSAYRRWKKRDKGDGKCF
jgi:hypothetical protein